MSQLEQEARLYMQACYGELRYLPTTQRKEIEQAFISGMVAAANSPLTRDQIMQQARKRLLEIGAFPSEDN